MTRGDSGESEPKPDLLELWAGEPAEPAPPPPSGLHWLVQALLAVAALAVILLLAKYAIDILIILVGLTAVGVVLHVVGERVVQSNLLSPGWIWPTVIAVGVGVFIAYPVFAPEGAASLSGYVPKVVVDFFDWSESHGWGHRALYTQPGTAPARAPRSGASAASGASQGGARSGDAPIALSASSPTSSAGQRVIFTARLAAGTDASEVSFYDGATRIGAGTVLREGTGRVAYLAVKTLPPGTHEITAEIPSPLGLPSRRSAPVRITVQ